MRKSKIHYILALILGIPLFLYLDSPYFAYYTEYAQDIATLVVFAVFMTIYKRSSSRYRTFMLIGIAVGFAGEFIFSKLLGMYHYRLDNIPLWVGFGHSLIFISVHKVIRIPYLLKHKQEIFKVLLAFIIMYSLSWLIFANDVFGFITTLMFLGLLLLNKQSRMFFTVMFLIVCYIEIVGTTTGSWYWPDVLMGRFDSIPSANPPSGIALFYFLFDYLILSIYFLLQPKFKQKYKRVNS